MSSFEIEAFTLLALAIIAITVRIVARWTVAGPKNFQLDDYLMPIAGVRSVPLSPALIRILIIPILTSSFLSPPNPN
jgi:hypothetical protein